MKEFLEDNAGSLFLAALIVLAVGSFLFFMYYTTAERNQMIRSCTEKGGVYLTGAAEGCVFIQTEAR